MNRLTLVFLLSTLGLSGCATTPCCDQQPSSSTRMPIPAPTQLVKISAVGYGAVSSYEGYTQGQKRLMAMRASKLDAYRALAEHVYGIRVTGNSTVSSMMAQNDSFRIYVDSYVRGAKVVSVTPMADGNYETVLEIELDQDFSSRMN